MSYLLMTIKCIPVEVVWLCSKSTCSSSVVRGKRKETKIHYIRHCNKTPVRIAMCYLTFQPAFTANVQPHIPNDHLRLWSCLACNWPPNPLLPPPSVPPVCGPPQIWIAKVPDTNKWSTHWYPSCGGAIGAIYNWNNGSNGTTPYIHPVNYTHLWVCCLHLSHWSHYSQQI